MQYLPSGHHDEQNHGLVHADNVLLPYSAPQRYSSMNSPIEEGSSLQLGRLLRKYWLLLAALVLLGTAAGFVSIILSSPMYQAHLLLEVEHPSGGLLRTDGGGGGDSSETEIATQIGILQSASFRKRGVDRLQSDNAPLAPTGTDIFSRLRQRIHPDTQNPIEAARTGTAVAIRTFTARPVNRTRLLELNCESTSPDIAAQFLNSIGAEFIEDTSQSRTQTAQRTSQWIAEQIDETKQKVQEAEERLRDFVQASGNVFAGQDSTLDDAKLTQLKSELARIQSERIARQTRYELTQKYPPEQLAEILDDPVLRGYQQQIELLKREKAALLTTYTERHEKVRKVDAQLAQVLTSLESETISVINRIKHDYEASRQQERLLGRDYAGQSQRVGSEAGKASQFNALKRDVETQRQMYQTLLIQQNQTSLSGSVPVSPIRVIEQAVPPDAPYKPRPVLNISFGIIFGVAFTAGLVFLKERTDRSIKVPGTFRQLFDAPELGVIPNLGTNGTSGSKPARLGSSQNGNHEDSVALIERQNVAPFVTESFRNTLASIVRNQTAGRAHKIILVTSPGPSEGKTTVVQNLGIVLAESGRKVLLVDADFRRPHLHRKFGLPNEWGLIDLLCEDVPLADYPPERLETPSGIPGLSILPNRVTQNNVAKALYSPRLRAIVEAFSKRYDMILLDAPPILSVADARIIAPLADSLILVLRAGATDRQSAMEAYQRIQEDGVSLLGTILTDYDLSADRRRRYYYDYGERSRV
jgi:capsular exopolysaccharide synthesis family protein